MAASRTAYEVLVELADVAGEALEVLRDRATAASWPNRGEPVRSMHYYLGRERATSSAESRCDERSSKQTRGICEQPTGGACSSSSFQRASTPGTTCRPGFLLSWGVPVMRSC